MGRKFRVESNADHPFEFEAARLVEILFGKSMFAKGDVSCEDLLLFVKFHMRTTAHSGHTCDVAYREPGVLTGRVEISLNGLGLVTNPGPFLRQVVPHELAHVLTFLGQVVAAKGNLAELEGPDTGHGDAWTYHYVSLTGEQPLPPTHLAGLFDADAIRFRKGALAAVCSCEVKVVAGKLLAAARQGKVHCKNCNGAYQLTNDEAVLPEGVRQGLTYLRSEECERGI